MLWFLNDLSWLFRLSDNFTVGRIKHIWIYAWWQDHGIILFRLFNLIWITNLNGLCWNKANLWILQVINQSLDVLLSLLFLKLIKVQIINSNRNIHTISYLWVHLHILHLIEKSQLLNSSLYKCKVKVLQWDWDSLFDFRDALDSCIELFDSFFESLLQIWV